MNSTINQTAGLRQLPPRQERALDKKFGGKGAFGTHILARIEQGDKVEDLAREYALSPSTLYRWVNRWLPQTATATS